MRVTPVARKRFPKLARHETHPIRVTHRVLRSIGFAYGFLRRGPLDRVMSNLDHPGYKDPEALSAPTPELLPYKNLFTRGEAVILIGGYARWRIGWWIRPRAVAITVVNRAVLDCVPIGKDPPCANIVPLQVRVMQVYEQIVSDVTRTVIDPTLCITICSVDVDFVSSSVGFIS